MKIVQKTKKIIEIINTLYIFIVFDNRLSKKFLINLSKNTEILQKLKNKPQPVQIGL
jgi:hypothetical protein